MACPPKWTIFYFIIYLVAQNNEVYCQYSPEGCEPYGDLLGALVKELGEKEKSLLLNALLSIATNNGIIPDLSPLIPSRQMTNNVAQTNSVPQTLNAIPLTARPDIETPYCVPEPPQNDYQNQYVSPDLLIPTQTSYNDIIITLNGIPNSPYADPASAFTSPPPSSRSPPPPSSQSSASSQSSSSSYLAPSQLSSSSQSSSSSYSTPSRSASTSQSTSSSQSITPSYSPTLSSLSSSSHSSASSQSAILQPPTSHSPAPQPQVSQSNPAPKPSTPPKSASISPPSSPSPQPPPNYPKPTSTPVSSSPSSQPLPTSSSSSPKPSEKPTPLQTAESRPVGGTANAVPSNTGRSSNICYYEEFPMIPLEINLPAPHIPEPRITIVTAPAPVEKKTSPLKKMLPLILIAMLCNNRNNQCPCVCESPSIVPIPYPFPIPFPTCGNYNDDDDDDDDDIPKKGNRHRREDFDYWEGRR
ncbi:leucine-rich repeat extensin-like protein 5 [Aricia agestis]|uniref:leucine-rich repeat extensin-like protein 5 n=1 Tax=Aricia agestis TaxID=91739 RepID=UPI001C206547|nr:leucine-rich repeat extensin-like protein 5 [Aricia agestis]